MQRENNLLIFHSVALLSGFLIFSALFSSFVFSVFVLESILLESLVVFLFLLVSSGVSSSVLVATDSLS